MPFATHEGVRIHYEVEGSGPPLILHTGLMCTLAIWEQFGYIDALKDHYRLIVFDARGHGTSDRPRDPDAYRPEHRVVDVLSVLDAVGIERSHYFGYSLGGRAGYELAVRAPQRFLSLAIGGQHPFARDPRPSGEQAALLRREGMAGLVAAAERNSGPISEARRERWLAQDAGAIAAYYDAIGAWPDLEAELPGITLPALLFCGDKDPSHAGMERAAALMPRAAFVSLPGLDHGQAGEASDLIVPHLRALHARVETTAAGGA